MVIRVPAIRFFTIIGTPINTILWIQPLTLPVARSKLVAHQASADVALAHPELDGDKQHAGHHCTPALG